MRVVIFGGSFDPVHCGHLAMANCAREELSPNRFLWAPAWHSPGKPSMDGAAPEERVALLECVIQEREAEEIYAGEIVREGTSWTVDTLRDLEILYPGANFTLLIGADCLGRLVEWKNVEEVFHRASFAVCPRGGKGAETLEEMKSQLPENLRGLFKAVMLSMKEHSCSSTLVRKTLRDGGNLDHLVPVVVANEIAKLDMYQTS